MLLFSRVGLYSVVHSFPTRRSSDLRITSAVAGRRGQMLGMGPRDGWTGWDRIEALIPEAELSGLEAERSEEHTSELQSRFDLVCRLLLEKKKHDVEPDDECLAIVQ